MKEAAARAEAVQERKERSAIEDRARALEEAKSKESVRANELAEELETERQKAEELDAAAASLRNSLRWRTISLEILLLGVAAMVAAMWLTKWWP